MNPGVDRESRQAAWIGRLLVYALIYMVLLGGTDLGVSVSQLRLVTGLLGGAIVVTLVLTARSTVFDRIDHLVIGALLLFVLTAALSSFPRQSFDAALAAVAFAATFFLARTFVTSAGARRLLLVALQTLSALLTFVIAVRWLGSVAEWWAGTGWSAIPPLNFELPAFPWAHRHDLTLLIVLLYPAWWIGPASPIRRVLAIATGVGVALIVIVEGSRAVWLAIGCASAIAVAPTMLRFWRSSARARTATIGVAAVAVIGLVVTGLGASLLERALSPTSLGWRASMWGPLVEQWADHPIAGNGPGSFPWVLQLTDYFDTNSWAPRHPDTPIFQAIAESGALGLAAIGLVLAALVPVVLRTPSRPVRWALVTFGVACIGTNPTDFGFLVVLIIAWAALAAPRDATQRTPAVLARPSLAGGAVLASLAVITIAYGSTTVGAVAYNRARAAAATGDLAAAAHELEIATTADPGMALYWRQLGVARWLNGDRDAAIADLRTAAARNPADDVAWRVLGLAYLDAEEGAAGREAIQRALDLKRTDPANLLLDVRVTENPGRGLGEVVQAWPEIVFSDAWASVLPAGITTSDIVAAALDRWNEQAPIPELPRMQGIWLQAMAGHEALDLRTAGDSGLSPALSDALFASIRCEDADRLLDAMGPDEQRSHLYWWLRARDAQLDGNVDDDAARMAELMGFPLRDDLVDRVLNPLNESGRYSGYGWGYRRQAIIWPSIGLDFPSPGGGIARWLNVPREAAESSGLGHALPACLP